VKRLHQQQKSKKSHLYERQSLEMADNPSRGNAQNAVIAHVTQVSLIIPFIAPIFRTSC